jgi:hypothetical protein
MAHHPLPWVCSGAVPAGVDPGTGLGELVVEEHKNWHCTFPVPGGVSQCDNSLVMQRTCFTYGSTEYEYGDKFVSFHRQFIQDFDVWRLATNPAWGRVTALDIAPGIPIPGDDETTNTAYTNCGNNPGGTRPAGAPCNGCMTLPTCLSVAGPEPNLDNFTSLGAVGAELECSGYHKSFHDGAATAPGATCDDMSNMLAGNAPRDPSFWKFHKKMDEIARDWQRLQAADVVIVIDRSGSMNDNCPAGSNTDCMASDINATPCKLSDARQAARMFADMIQDDRPGSNAEHRIGIVSFATDAKVEFPLTLAAGVVGNSANNNDSAFDTALNNLTACGNTSIGLGLHVADSLLATGSNPHKAILLLSDGKENTPRLISDVTGELGPEVIVCAVGYGIDFSDPEDRLRALCEDHGGIFIADDDLDPSAITLQKFFVDAFGQIYDTAIATDPIDSIPAGYVSTTPITTSTCGTDARLTFVLGRQFGTGFSGCPLNLTITAPNGDLVKLSDSGIETSDGANWTYVHIPLPYHGVTTGTWTAYGIRPQTTFVHGFVTDAFVTPQQGINLVRNEIHRLFPRGAATALYYEDGSKTGTSTYRDALNQEVAAGGITSLTTATSAADFNTKLAQTWDLIVFARQLNPTPQVYDTNLKNKICAGQKALLTDFYLPPCGVSCLPNAILQCAGTNLVPSSTNWNQIIGDGRLLVGTLQLRNPGYTTYTMSLALCNCTSSPYRIQSSNEREGGAIVGNGTLCGTQTYFSSTLVRGFGRVDPAVIFPKAAIGQKIRATFRMTESNRPASGWDAVAATVTLDRPGNGALETYTLSDNGTNGDVLANDNYWTVEIPSAATVAGPHILHAKFHLTEGGCSIDREAEYAINVQADATGHCTRLQVPPRRVVWNGEAVELVTCATNLCARRDSVRITVTDTKRWLCTKDKNGNYVPITSAQFTIGGLTPNTGACSHTVYPLYACVPLNAAQNDTTVVSFTAHSFVYSQNDTTSSMTVRATARPTDVPPPPAPPELTVRAIPNSANHTVTFDLALPATSHVQLRIYDVRGRLVATAFDGEMPASIHTSSSVVWSGRGSNGQLAASGIYTYRVDAGGNHASGTIVLVR